MGLASACSTPRGTTGNPKGAVYSHRGAYLGALANALTFKLDHESRYLWTLPMFHCSGWTFTWAVTAAGATHVCLRKVEPKRIFDAIVEHRVTHMCGAPIVLNMLVHAPADAKRPLPLRTKVATGGAAPPAVVIERMEAMGFEVLHLYGTTESYGPSTYCAPMSEWQELPESERYALMARQGIPNPVIEHMMVADPKTLEPVPRDGATIGELMLAGNTLMKGYLKNEAATEEAFAGGVYHSGDLAVWHADGSMEVKDRSKDIIISGGENISSLEVEEVLYRHPQVMEAAVVARSDAKWGEHPCAFVTLKPEQRAGHGGGHHRLLPRQHGALQGAAHGRVRAAAQDLDRQDPEVRAARPGQEPWPDGLRACCAADLPPRQVRYFSHGCGAVTARRARSFFCRIDKSF